MPKSNLDWLGIASLWVGAIIMAVKGGGLTLIKGVPVWLSSQYLSYIPLFFVSFYAFIGIYRYFYPATDIAIRPSSTPLLNHGEAQSKHEIIESMWLALTDEKTSEARKRGAVRDAELALPRVKAAILSAHKRFGTRLPSQFEDINIDLEIQCRILERIIPLIRMGHIEEARTEVDLFIEKIVNNRSISQPSGEVSDSGSAD